MNAGVAVYYVIIFFIDPFNIHFVSNLQQSLYTYYYLTKEMF